MERQRPAEYSRNNDRGSWANYTGDKSDTLEIADDLDIESRYICSIIL